MNGPPTNIAAGDLWAQICAIPRPSRVADFPRLDPASGKPVARVRLMVLTQEEQMLCASAAEKITRAMLKDVPKGDDARRGYDDVYNNAAAIEILFRACKKEEDATASFFPTPQAIRQALSIDEVGVLFSEYLMAQTELGPIVSKMSPEEMDAWVERLGEGGAMFPLASLSSEMLTSLAFGLACQLHALRTATSSVGSPLEEPATETANADSPPNS